jgi:hypothetical protein
MRRHFGRIKSNLLRGFEKFYFRKIKFSAGTVARVICVSSLPKRLSSLEIELLVFKTQEKYLKDLE